MRGPNWNQMEDDLLAIWLGENPTATLRTGAEELAKVLDDRTVAAVRCRLHSISKELGVPRPRGRPPGISTKHTKRVKRLMLTAPGVPTSSTDLGPLLRMYADFLRDLAQGVDKIATEVGVLEMWARDKVNSTKRTVRVDQNGVVLSVKRREA